MELSKKGIADRTAFEQKGYALPQFDREEMIAKTKKTPHWIHFGAGNIFRAFQANVMQELLITPSSTRYFTLPSKDWIHSV